MTVIIPKNFQKGGGVWEGGVVGEGAWREVDEIRDNQMAIKRKCKKHKVMRRWSYGYMSVCNVAAASS